MQRQPQVILGVSGGVSAYKAVELVRQLKKARYAVRVMMSKSACEFVNPLTFQAISGNPVHSDLFDASAQSGMDHIELARWADAVVIAPASADIIAKIAQGRADDLVSTVCLTTQAPLAIAPAMNAMMWQNQATQDNVKTLRERAILLWGPAEGEQACGEVGLGRLLEPSELVTRISYLTTEKELQGKTVVITAGPTRESIDPVRYITNHSSGKMGYALAQAARAAGAEVRLIAGPTALPDLPEVAITHVNTAEQMLDAVKLSCQNADIFIGTAAVADFTPQNPLKQKLKKSAIDAGLELKLARTPDILSQVAAENWVSFTAGFAAETQNLEAHAREKLMHKGIDLIAANDVSHNSIGFGSDDNALTVLTRTDKFLLPEAHKLDIAKQLLSIIQAAYMTKLSISQHITGQ